MDEQTKKDREKRLTPKEAAEHLGVSVAALSGWRQHKKGPPFYKIGMGNKGRVSYLKGDLDDWLATRYVLTDDE